ncbi:MAG: hypothetical protein ACYCYP_11065 [Leptospirales bacterium]
MSEELEAAWAGDGEKKIGAGNDRNEKSVRKRKKNENLENEGTHEEANEDTIDPERMGGIPGVNRAGGSERPFPGCRPWYTRWYGR